MKPYLNILIVFFPFFMNSCNEEKRSIYVLCDKGLKGDYELRWEIYPEPENTSINIFSSNNDSSFPTEPTAVVNSDDYIAVMNITDTTARQFFKVKVRKNYSGIVSNRFFDFDSIQNFRDVGGYYTSNNRQVRWGKLFRSGNLKRLTERDSAELQKLNIKTIIDMRAKDASLEAVNPIHADNYYRLPVGYSSFEIVATKIQKNHFMRGDAMIYTQDLYKDIIENNTEELAQFFDYLCDESNYPITYNCFFGKDQSGLVTYFLLRALDIPAETIEEDYMASNKGIKKPRLMHGIDTLTEAGQEALTLVSNTDVAYLRYALSCIRKKSGSVEEYMLNDLRLTPEKRQKLQDILLYPDTAQM